VKSLAKNKGENKTDSERGLLPDKRLQWMALTGRRWIAALTNTRLGFGWRSPAVTNRLLFSTQTSQSISS
jgi:hypothetical protein